MKGVLLLYQQRFLRQLGLSAAWGLPPTGRYQGSQHLLHRCFTSLEAFMMGLGVFQVGKSFHQLSSVLGGDGGVPPQKQSLNPKTALRPLPSDGLRSGSGALVSYFSCFPVILSSGIWQPDSEITLSNIKQWMTRTEVGLGCCLRRWS